LKCKTPHEEEILKNDVLLIVLSDEEAKDATSFSEKDEDDMPIVTKRGIQEYKYTQTMY
jgi:hypothetical protein